MEESRKGTYKESEMIEGSAHEVLTQSMVDLVLSMARSLVDQPDEVRVQAAQERDGTLLMLCVAPADLGKVIGKQGRTARSIRTILGAASMKAQHRFGLDIEQAPPQAVQQDSDQ
jgi:predicted RNA-binding protein YlqC (UPF0109 family)